MFARSSWLAVLFLIAAAVGCGAAAEEPVEEGVVEQKLSTFRISLFFSDPELTQMVGERSSLCTSTSNWGVRTPWVYKESGSCEWDYNVGPAEWPDGEGACVCCNDSNGDGSCDGDPSFHFCDSSFNCF